MILEKQQFDLWLFLLKQQKKILSFTKPVCIADQISKAKSVCICMPQNHTHFDTALACVNRIVNNEINVTIVVDRNEAQVDGTYQGKILKYPLSLKRSFPIKDKELDYIPTHYDIAIDLSPEPNELSAYITGSRGRKMTIGLKSGHLDVFYTALIEPVGEYEKAVETMLGLAGLIIDN